MKPLLKPLDPDSAIRKYGFCPNDECHIPELHCLFWRLQLPQSFCMHKTLNDPLYSRHPCLVLDGDAWFTQLFEPKF